MKTYYLGNIPFNGEDSIAHGRTKGSRNGISTTPGYKAIGELAKGPQAVPDSGTGTVQRKRRSLWSRVSGAATSAYKSASKYASKYASTAARNVGNAATSAYKSASKYASTAVRNVGNAATSLYSTTKDAVKQRYSAGKDFVTQFFGAASGAVSKLTSGKRDYKNEVDSKVRQAIRTGDQSYFGRGGTVDLNRRPVIPSDWLSEMGYDVEPGGTATVFSHSTSIGENGEHAVTVTPILPNGDVLERETIEAVLDNVYLGRDGKPHLDGDDWGFNLNDILISHYDVSDVPPKKRSEYINAMANGLHEVQEALYRNVEPIEEPTWDIPSIRDDKEQKGKAYVNKILKKIM